MDAPVNYERGGMASDDEEEDKASSVDVLMADPPDITDIPPAEERNVQPSNRRSRKREDALCSKQLNAVRHEIAEVKASLDKMQVGVEVEKTAKDVLKTQKRIEFLQTKLEAHHRWMNDLQKLLVSAPLLDFALRHPNLDTRDDPPDEEEEEESKEDTVSSSVAEDPQEVQRDLSTLDEWQEDAAGKIFSSILIAKHVHSFVSMSQTNAHLLLDEFADPACDFAVQFDTRGWTIGANLDSKLLTFRASRVLLGASAANIAAAIWKSLQYDDILRTFAPTVLDATPVFESDTSRVSVVERAIQIEVGTVKSLVLVDSMEDYTRDGAQCWQIAVETCDDPCVNAFAAQSKVADSASPPVSPFTVRSSPNSLDVVIAARCAQLGLSGVLVQIAGSVQHYGTSLVPAKSHVDLAQYMINMLPVYEELQLLART